MTRRRARNLLKIYFSPASRSLAYANFTCVGRSAAAVMPWQLPLPVDLRQASPFFDPAQGLDPASHDIRFITMSYWPQLLALHKLGVEGGTMGGPPSINETT